LFCFELIVVGDVWFIGFGLLIKICKGFCFVFRSGWLGGNHFFVALGCLFFLAAKSCFLFPIHHA
jgi:hypothetical protein